MDLMNPKTSQPYDRRAMLIVVLAIVASVAAILALSIFRDSGPAPVSNQSGALVMRILGQNQGESITVKNLIQGCMARVNSSPELMETFLSNPNICMTTIQPVALRVYNGEDVCRLGDAHCAFLSGYLRVVAATGAYPQTPDEIAQMTSTVESEFQKLQQRKGQ